MRPVFETFRNELASMGFRRHRTRRWIALIALLGLLFQQFAMATYSCPLERDDAANAAAMAQTPPCRSPDMNDKARCEQHCHPLAQTTDHATPPTVPAALLPATTWLRDAGTTRIDLAEFIECAIDARATAPPLTVRYCTFQI